MNHRLETAWIKYGSKKVNCEVALENVMNW